MTIPMTATEIFDRKYLELRAKILQLAASFDRLERGAGDIPQDGRWQLLEQGINTLLEKEPNRAERVQLIFSNMYDENWQTTLGMPE